MVFPVAVEIGDVGAGIIVVAASRCHNEPASVAAPRMIAVGAVAACLTEFSHFARLEVLHIEVRRGVPDVELSEVAKRKQYVASVGADARQRGTLADGRAVHLDNGLAEGARLFVKSEAHQVVAQTVVEARDGVLSRRGVRSLKLWHISRGVVEFLAVGRPAGESFEVVVGFQDVGQRTFVAIKKHEVGAEVHHLHLLSVVDVERLSRLVGREHHPVARGMPSGVDR